MQITGVQCECDCYSFYILFYVVSQQVVNVLSVKSPSIKSKQQLLTRKALTLIYCRWLKCKTSNNYYYFFTVGGDTDMYTTVGLNCCFCFFLILQMAQDGTVETLPQMSGFVRVKSQLSEVFCI